MSVNLKEIYRVFDPAPLERNSDLYVELDEVRGSKGLANELGNHIRMSNKPTCQLLAGHKGSGKSTELKRLCGMLEEGAEKFFTVYCELEDLIDPNDVDFPDILMVIVGQLGKQFKERLGIHLKPGYFRQRWEELKGFLGSEVTLETLDLATGIGTISAKIKDSPRTRREIRKQLEPSTNNWIAAANDVISEAVLELSKKGYAGLVIVVDDLDKITNRIYENTDYTLPEYLFLNRSPQLSAFDCHIMYTIPISLAYSCKERNLASLYGFTAPPIVPMTKITDADNKPTEGFEKFKDIVDRRLHQVSARIKDVFPEGVLDQLIRYSGGQPRELMTLTRDTLVKQGIPILAESVEQVARNIRHAYDRQLRVEHWEVIRQVGKTHKLVRNEQNDDLCMDLLDSRAILQYRNHDEWYGLNPLLPEYDG